jgi:hypothetical protein
MKMFSFNTIKQEQYCRAENVCFRILHSYLGNKIMQDEMGGLSGACSMHSAIRNGYNILIGNPEGKRPLGRPRRRWENISFTSLRKI